MCKKITFLVLLVFGYVAAKATYQTVPITASSFNVDVVANGVGAPSLTSNAALDDASATTGYVFCAENYNYDGSCTPIASPYFLPNSGTLTSPVATTFPGVTYQLASYSGNNCLRLLSGANSGTLNFVTPVTAGEVYLLLNSGAAASTIDVTVNFADAGPSQSFTNISVLDWYTVSTTTMVVKAARVSRTKTVCGNDGTPASDNGPCLYQLQLPLSVANFSRLVSSITINRTNTATSYVNVMAVSINTPCITPADQATALNLTPTTSQISGTFTPAASNPSGYLVVRYPTGATPTAPAVSTNYTVGQALGTGTVVYTGANTTFTATGLFANTTYDFYVYTYNNTSCGGGPLYNTTSPLTGSMTTALCGGPANITLTVGTTGQDFFTLTDAISSLSNSGISGPVVLELASSYIAGNEPQFPIIFPFNPCVSTTNTLTIRPAASAPGLVITSSNAGPTIDFNGASNIILDGSPGGVGGFSANNLKIINTNNAGAAIRFINDATNNTIKSCDLQGQNTSNTTSGLSGVVYFGTASTTNLVGNDNNTITYCNIHGVSSATTPAIGVVSYGTTTNAASYNDNCTISYCNVYDYFQAATSTYGIKLDQGNSSWTVSNNNLYQSVARQYSGSVAHKGMHINSNGSGSSTMTPQGSGFIITDNFIGGDGAGGNTNMSGTTTSITYTYMAMDISVGVGAPTVVKNNVIKNFVFSTANVSATAPNFIGINGNYGNLNINHNTIGDPVTNGTITATRAGTSATAGLLAGIRIAGGITNNIDSNVIAGITTVGSGTVPYSIVGLYATGGSGVNGFTGNTVGDESTYSSIYASTTGGTQILRGIWVTGGTATNIVNNTIARMYNSGTATGAQVAGIVITTSTANITGNKIHDLITTSTSTSAGASAPALGIGFSSTAAGYNLSSNKIYNLTVNTATTTSNVVGIFISGPSSGTNTVSKNFIYRLFTPSTGAATVTGFDVGGGMANYSNNMISLGHDTLASDMTNGALIVRGISKGTSTNNNFYHNSVYIGGTATTAGSARTFAFQRNNQGGTDTIMNNIFVNDRSNSGATATHYAISFGPTTGTGGNISNVILNYNVYRASGTGGVMGYTTTDVPSYAAGWIAGDNNSLSVNPNYFEPINGAGSGTPDLHISGASPIESAGFPVASVTDDFDGDVRANNTPTDIGADAGLFVPIDLSAPAISYTPLANACNTNDRVLTVTITDASGVATSGLDPRVYFRKGTGTWVSNAGTLASGTINNGTWNFTISSTAMGGLNPGDAVSYYVIAQDIASPVNIGSTPGGATASDVNNVTIHPAIPNTYVVGANLAGSYNVGAGGTFNTLTAGIGIYNSCPVAGAVVFNLTDPTYPGETFPITINSNTAASASNTLTIKPASGMSTTITGSTASSGLIKLNGADYVIIDGSNAGGTDRNLTIANTNTTNPAAIQLVSLGTGAGATNNTIKNCIINNNVTTATSYGIVIGGSSVASNGADNDTVTIQNNAISGVTTGIYAIGTASVSAGGIDKLNIVKNSITANVTGSSNLAEFGMQLGNALNSNITGDTISVNNGYASNSTSPVGISLETGFISSVVSGNMITKVLTAGTGGYGGRGIMIGTGTATSNLTIANNVIYGVNGSNWSGFTNSSSMGICIGGIGNSTTLGTTAGGIKLYNNSVNMYGTYSYASTACNTAALYVGSGASALDVRNNIFMNSMSNTTNSGSKNYAIYSVAANSSFTNLDYNMYNVSGTQGVLAYINADKTTIDALRAATTKDTSSVSGTIPFVSDVNLQLDATTAAAWNVFGRGIALTSVGTDINGSTRSTTVGIPITIGAYEIATPSSTPDDMVMTPATPTSGTPTVFTSAGRKIAEVNWTGAVPTTMSAKYYPGIPPPSATTTPNINSYFEILATPSTGLGYTIKTYYTQAEGNGIADANMSMIKRDGANPWAFTSPSNFTADVNGKFVTSIALNSFSQFSMSGGINPLGVSLVSFNGIQKGSINQLQWTTENETSNSGFELQRSANGKDFDKMSFIPSKAKNGTSAGRLAYSFDDEAPLEGNNYYRLKQIDLSGKINYSNVILLNNRIGGIAMSNIYPNPADNFISMSISASKDQEVSYSIMDVSGKVIMQSAGTITKGSNTLNWNISSLAAGNYFIRISTEEGNQVARFTKN